MAVDHGAHLSGLAGPPLSRLRRRRRHAVPAMAFVRPVARSQGERHRARHFRRGFQGREAEPRSARPRHAGREAEDAEEAAPGRIRLARQLLRREDDWRRHRGRTRPRITSRGHPCRSRAPLRRARRGRARRLGPRVRFRHGKDPARRFRGARHQGLHGHAQGHGPQGSARRARDGREGARGAPAHEDFMAARSASRSSCRRPS